MFLYICETSFIKWLLKLFYKMGCYNVATCDAAIEVVWLCKFLKDLEVVLDKDKPLTLYCANSGAVANSKNPRSHKRCKHIEQKYIYKRYSASRRCSGLEDSIRKQSC